LGLKPAISVLWEETFDCQREDDVEIKHHVLVLLLAINATYF
jgi:hypothetical protein